MEFRRHMRAILSDSTGSIGVVELGECVHILDCLGVDTDRGRLPLSNLEANTHALSGASRDSSRWSSRYLTSEIRRQPAVLNSVDS
jgi:hypothetical protein